MVPHPSPSAQSWEKKICSQGRSELTTDPQECIVLRPSESLFLVRQI